MVSGRGHGKGSKGLGPGGVMLCPCTRTPPLLSPTPTGGPEPAGRLQSGGNYCLAASPELCPIQALFLAPRRKRKRKQRKELLFSVEPSPGKDSRACWAREGRHC